MKNNETKSPASQNQPAQKEELSVEQNEGVKVSKDEIHISQEALGELLNHISTLVQAVGNRVILIFILILGATFIICLTEGGQKALSIIFQ